MLNTFCNWKTLKEVKFTGFCATYQEPKSDPDLPCRCGEQLQNRAPTYQFLRNFLFRKELRPINAKKNCFFLKGRNHSKQSMF